jgi:hypothetical protein
LLRRVRYETLLGKKWAWERVAAEVHTSPQALAVVNTRKDALALLDALGDDPWVLHLSTQLCGAHRAKVLGEVKARLGAGRPCRLCDYAGGLDLPPTMYLRTPIRWLLDLDPTGKLLGQPVRTKGSGGKHDRGKEFLAPHRERTAQVLPKLLADNAEYVLGIAHEPTKRERVDHCHAAFVALVRDCAGQTGHAAVRAVARSGQPPGGTSMSRRRASSTASTNGPPRRGTLRWGSRCWRPFLPSS